ncbi:hypothetical protein ABEB36_004857 [Hypothenemus hampei]|uniref:RHD domain-containing protein n=1 Tax=Hypothenemus hampei TaxID=57062 RepID=A0ABD1EW31_HYPHA
MLNGGGQVLQHTNSSNQNSTRARCAAELEIIEQPASKALRFRYECEGRSAGSIPGASSTPENKTYPEIAIRGYQGNAVVLVSCVTKDSPYLAHPHNLVGKGCTKGVCTMHVLPENMMRVQFQNLGIQCVKKRDIESSLVKRQQIRVDPYKNGFRHKNSATSIDLNAVRLCFQAYLPDQEGKMTVPLRPVVSDVIYDKKAIADLSIVGLCSCVSHVNGGTSLILLCEKVAKEDIEIHFFEEDAHGNRVWQEKADFQPSNVHKQTAIMFKTPPYRTLDISEPVRVHIQLYRPSDRMTSEALPFEYLPLDSGYLGHTDNKKRKRAKTEPSYQRILEGLTLTDKIGVNIMSTLNPVKMEPNESTSPYGGTSPSGGCIMYQMNQNFVPTPSVSPQYNDLASTPSPDNIHTQYRHQSVDLNNFNETDMVWTPVNFPQAAVQDIAAGHWNIQDNQTNPMGHITPHLLDLDEPPVNSGDLQDQLNGISNSEPLKEIGNLSFTDLSHPQTDI